jgi:NAD(P)-dependent dehydrogenase (short-subunit alcohol dehydrogenase family)
MDLRLGGKVAVITGGSRGIGKAIARALAREGVDVALIARDLAAAEATAAEIACESGRTVRAYRADTGQDSEVHAAFAAIASDFDRIDVLVNNAAKVAGHGPPPTLATITDDDFWGDVNIKVLGYVRCAREVAPIMQRQGFGRIINISGLAARWTGSIVGSIRNVSVAALTANLAEELGPHGINVTCVPDRTARRRGRHLAGGDGATDGREQHDPPHGRRRGSRRPGDLPRLTEVDRGHRRRHRRRRRKPRRDLLLTAAGPSSNAHRA